MNRQFWLRFLWIFTLCLWALVAVLCVYCLYRWFTTGKPEWEPLYTALALLAAGLWGFSSWLKKRNRTLRVPSPQPPTTAMDGLAQTATGQNIAVASDNSRANVYGPGAHVEYHHETIYNYPSKGQALDHGKTIVPQGKTQATIPTETVQVGQIAVARICFSLTNQMRSGRAHHAAELLPDGRVLLIGGVCVDHNISPLQEVLSSVEIFNPESQEFASYGKLVIRRYFYASIRLPSNNILVMGGVSEDGQALDTVELYDVCSKTFSIIGRMTTARRGHTATLLRNGQVLIAGGNNSTCERLDSAEIYDPVSNTFLPTSRMIEARLTEHTRNALCLEDGRVVIAGGYGEKRAMASIEIYDPKTKQFSSGGQMATARCAHAMTELLDGTVLITGGYEESGGHLLSAELYDPDTHETRLLSQMHVAHFHHTATRMPDGRVVIAGGFSPIVELYDPNFRTFSVLGQMNAVRYLHTTNLLKNGQIVLIGGASHSGTSISTAEIGLFN